VFAVLSLPLTLLLYCVFAWGAWQGQGKMYGSLREHYPYQSIEDRLPVKRVPPEQPLSQEGSKRLFDLESAVWQEGNPERGYTLQRVHEQTVDWFVSSPGFGVMRMSTVSEARMNDSLRESIPIPQPIYSSPADRLADPREPGARAGAGKREPGNANPSRPSDPEASLHKMLQDSIVDFANPRGFGYAKDRRHVAGFQRHQFSAVPQSAERWELQTLYLLGLVVHEEPVVYVSGNLPRMDELLDAEARPPDAFEEAGLATLRRGEDLITQPKGDSLRMLGAIRSVKQCINCHGGERGDLLGAFSYTLKRR
jgi:hypothetical protein